ncbi:MULTISPECIES: LysR substrate-binding domain-containing protein [unclassified Acinetobacter]|uniref:LysR substrate-binding domain-containing protein n=1 Tax=unclassified Acinetobacter TaxID=196816 RepID=UPI002934CEE3|nr:MULTISPECIES: LysR substrate-binding domain-containing protein [unclassified Acinetobacter]WOE31646.1 LysR substrate-binding domain-containing protein [Acinetobacter sp. SAAs470]WOE37111.1 LysR substrate-binding domain-containing protein [Acinetobacter sp. SAAs474]
MRRYIPSLQNLLCFESAAKHMSYTHAAQEMYMTQSAISRQIQQLEDFLDVKLFTRTRHGVELTIAGQHYFAQIKPLLLELEQKTLDLKSHKGLGGTLKLGVVPTFATCWLLPKLDEFHKIHPEITIHIETNTKPFLFNETIFDGAIYAGTEQQIHLWPDIDAHYLMQEDLIAVCSPELLLRYFPNAIKTHPYGYDLSPEQLIQLPLLQQTTRPAIWQEWFNHYHIEHHKVFDGHRHELFSMLSVAAKQSMGMALIPQILIETELRHHQLVMTAQHQHFDRRAYYFVHQSQASSPLIDKFIQWIKTTLSHHAPFEP